MMCILGLRFVADYIDESDETELIRTIEGQEWGTELKRRVQHYGYRYDYRRRTVKPEMYLGPLPDWLKALSDRLVESGFFPESPDQVIINEYQPGQGIAQHVDRTCFGDSVASLSLGSSCAMEFAKQNGEKVAIFLPARSLLVLSGDARYEWRHAIPGRRSDWCEGRRIARGRRLSLTFRSVLVDSCGKPEKVSQLRRIDRRRRQK